MRYAALLALFVLLCGLPLNAQIAKTQIFYLEDSPYGLPNGIVAGPDNNLWFTDGNGYIGSIDISGNPSYYTIPYPNPNPTSITAGVDGNIWFLDTLTNSVGKLDLANKSFKITEKQVTTPSSGLSTIVSGPDGALWFTERDANQIGRITVDGQMSEFKISTPNSSPQGITAGPDGALWFVETNVSKVGRINVTGAVTAEYPTPTESSYPNSITTGPDGALWFTEAIGQVGRATTAGSIVEYDVGRQGYASPFAITPGPEGSLWFLSVWDGYYPALGQIQTSGVYYGTNGVYSWPQALTTGPEGAIWLAEYYGWIVRAIPEQRRNGIDISGPAEVPSQTVLSQMLQAGIQYAVVKLPQAPDGGTAANQLNALSAAGIDTAGYCFLNLHRGSPSGSIQASGCLARLSNVNKPINFVALDVEDTTRPLQPQLLNIANIKDAIRTFISGGIEKIVIYTNQGDWATLVGADKEFAVYPLWNAGHDHFRGYSDPAGNLACAMKGYESKSLTPSLRTGSGLANLTLPAQITAFSIYSNIVTFAADNSFTAGQTVIVNGMQNGYYLNGQRLTILRDELSATQFAAKFVHPDQEYLGDSGEISAVLFGGWNIQSGTQYDLGGTYSIGWAAACLFGIQVDFDVFDPDLWGNGESRPTIRGKRGLTIGPRSQPGVRGKY